MSSGQNTESSVRETTRARGSTTNTFSAGRRRQLSASQRCWTSQRTAGAGTSPFGWQQITTRTSQVANGFSFRDRTNTSAAVANRRV